MPNSDNPQRRIDNICNRFEDQWSPDRPVDFDVWVRGIEPEFQKLLLVDLLRIDIELRFRAGQTVIPADYRNLGSPAVDMAARELELLAGKEPTGGNDDHPIGSQEVSSAGKAHSNHVDLSNAPRWIGPYRLMRQLGQGGMGTVWQAEQRSPVKRLVALKVVRSGLDGRQVIARFEAERQALALMDHPGISRVLDAGETESGEPYFVMELVKGIPITDYCDSQQLTVSERLELMARVCEAVQHAHQKGIIHRDLKPSNVLVTIADDKPAPKVIDFGLAKALEHTLQLTDKTLYTEFGQVLGTLQYMSPEQANVNSVDVDTRTDVYALGIMLYELLTGSTPLDQRTMGRNALLKVLELIRDSEPPRPSDRLESAGPEATTAISENRKIATPRLRQILRGELDWIVMKALEKDRSRRYETANSLADDIRRFLANEPVLARPPSATYRTRKFIRKHRVLVATAGTIAAMLIIGTVGASWFVVVLHRQKVAIEEQKSIADNALADSEGIRSQIRTYLLKHPGDPEVQQVLEQWKEIQELQVRQNRNLDLRSRSNAGSYEDLARLCLRTGENGTYTPASFQLSLDYLTQANEIRRALVDQSPDNAFLKRELAENLKQLVELLVRQGEPGKATEYVLQELSVYEQDPETFAVDIESAIDRALLFVDRSESRDNLLSRKLQLLENTSSPQVRRKVIRRLALDYANQSTRFSGDPLADMQKAHELFETLARDYPEHPHSSRDLAWSHGMMGDRSLAAGKVEKAIKHYRDEVHLLEESTNRQPGDLDDLVALSDARVRLADLLVDQEEFAQAALLFERDFDFWNQAAHRNPRPESRKNAAFARGKQAGVEQLKGRFSVAASLYEDAIERLTRLQSDELLDKQDINALNTYTDQLDLCRQMGSQPAPDPDLDF